MNSNNHHDRPDASNRQLHDVIALYRFGDTVPVEYTCRHCGESNQQLVEFTDFCDGYSR